MFQFLETIKIKNGKIRNLKAHQWRIDATFERFYGEKNHTMQLLTIFKKAKIENIFPNEKNKTFKCRFLYDDKNYHVEFHAYEIKSIHSFKIVKVENDFDYTFKYLNRENLNALNVDNQEVIIVKNDKITDTIYANIAFLKDGIWYTPDEPLLQGTKRKTLLEKNKIVEKAIYSADLVNFTHLKIFNAMLDWNDTPVFPIHFIQLK